MSKPRGRNSFKIKSNIAGTDAKSTRLTHMYDRLLFGLVTGFARLVLRAQTVLAK